MKTPNLAQGRIVEGNTDRNKWIVHYFGISRPGDARPAFGIRLAGKNGLDTSQTVTTEQGVEHNTVIF